MLHAPSSNENLLSQVYLDLEVGMSIEEAKMAKSIFRLELFSRPNVVGLGVGYKVRGRHETDEISIMVMVRQKLSPLSLASEEMIPSEVDGISTDVIEVGELRSFQSRTERIRPAPGGVSIGHYLISAGTLGCPVYDVKSGNRLILSNNHVLANRNEAQIGDPILQPGPADGGTPEKDTLALLERFEPIHYIDEPAACSIANSYVNIGNWVASRLGSKHRLTAYQYHPFATNIMDVALARPVGPSDLLDEIMEIGAVTESSEAVLGLSVMKSGRTTALTTGTINILDATVTVNYGSDRTATFDNQIVSTPMSEGGDSGSLLVAADTKTAVGLLFAGSSQATLFNPIQPILTNMQVSFMAMSAKSIHSRKEELLRIQAIKETYQHILMAKANVVGVGVGPIERGDRRSGEIGLVVMVREKLPAFMIAPEDLIPDEIDGVAVDVKEVGEFQAQ
jgi:hypothetical protein